MLKALSRIRLLILTEIIKLLKGRGFYFSLAGLAAAVAFIFIGTRQLDRASGVFRLNGYSAAAYVSTGTVGTWGVGLVLIVILGASTVAGEAGSGTLKSVLTRPVTRIDFVASKMAFLFIAVASLVLATLILGLILGGAFYGLGNVGERNYVIHSRIDMLSNMIYAYGLLVLPLFAISTVALFFSVVIKGVGGAIGASLGAYFVLNLLRGFPRLGDYTINTYINYPLEMVGGMAVGLPPVWSPWLYKCLAASLAYIVAFGGASVLIFHRKDII